MKEWIKKRNISKSKASENIVFRASSSENEIRFYIHAEVYIVARENKDGRLVVKIEEKQKKEKNSKSINEIIKDKKHLLNTLMLIILLLIISITFLVIVVILTKDFFISCFLFFFLVFFCRVTSVIICEYKFTTPSRKSKHSAEHMLVNFLNNNKRLPKSMSEIRKTSRFSINCGSRKKIQGCLEEFIMSTVSLLAFSFYMNFIEQKCENTIIMFIIVGIISLCIWTLISQCGIIKPILNVLNIIVQCSNTTKNVQDNDIQLAYYAAKYWLQIVYPQFYSEDNNIFNKNEES